MSFYPRIFRNLVVTSVLCGSLSGCLFGARGGSTSASTEPYCVSGGLAYLSQLSDPTVGKAMVFNPDPIVASGIASLGPSSHRLDEFRSEVTLSHLSGWGLLEGKYVDVRDGLSCDEEFAARSDSNDFRYVQKDDRFQQAMAYYFGDQYRSSLDEAGYLEAVEPIRIVAPCAEPDNAYYTRYQSDGRMIEKVCLGVSQYTAGANYADDASVTVHELQHGTTTHAYSQDPDTNLGYFYYDEAGAMNEAISDFMALMYLAPSTGSFDPRLFGRWSLGTFIPGFVNTRGSHRCAAYDSDYPNCSGFPAISAQNNTLSYVYPDGLGWPYSRNYAGPGFLRSTFIGHHYQEEIHNNAPILAGALWDVYSALLANHGGDAPAARRLMTRLVVESVQHLPKGSSQNLSPSTFRALASLLVDYAGAIGLTSADQADLAQVLTERGLYAGTQLAAGWAVADDVEPLRIEDNPSRLKAWLIATFGDPSIVQQGIQTGLNKRLDPGEVVALWFNLKNVSATSAGAVDLRIRSLTPGVSFIPGRKGYLAADQGEVQYSKINGTAVVSALSSANATFDVPTGNNYFKTNPFFDNRYTTATWVQVAPSVAHGAVARFEVTATPSNGAASTVVFTATIQ